MSDTKLLAKDLRIGNLHYYRMADDFDDRKEWTEISVIDANDILFLSENLDDENYSPIPLSEDVLVKLGFEKCLNGFWCSQEFLNVKIIDGEISIYISGTDQDLNWNSKIKYVNQLMNLYHSLTGEELIYTEN